MRTCTGLCSSCCQSMCAVLALLQWTSGQWKSCMYSTESRGMKKGQKERLCLFFSNKYYEWFKDNLTKTGYLKKDQVMTPLNFKYDLKNDVIAWEMVCMVLFTHPLSSCLHPCPWQPYCGHTAALFITDLLKEFNLQLKEGLHYWEYISI